MLNKGPAHFCMIGCQFCINVFIIVNKAPTKCCVETQLNFVAGVTKTTGRGQLFSIALPGLTAKLNNNVLKSIHTKSDILKES